jgi:hypothetical protein
LHITTGKSKSSVYKRVYHLGLNYQDRLSCSSS